jgi:chemotaxis protein histidine kinase CheA
MMGAVEKEDLDDLIEILKQVVTSAEHLLDDSGNLDGLDRCRQDLQSFHTTASMLGLNLLEQVGIALENYVRNDLSKALPMGADAITPFVSAATTLADEMRRAASGEAELSFDPQAIIEVLQTASPGGATGGEITELSPDEFPPGFLGSATDAVQERLLRR